MCSIVTSSTTAFGTEADGVRVSLASVCPSGICPASSNF